MNPWAVIHNPLDMARKLGEILGMKTTNLDRLLEFFRSLPARVLAAVGRLVLSEVMVRLSSLESTCKACKSSENDTMFVGI